MINLKISRGAKNVIIAMSRMRLRIEKANREGFFSGASFRLMTGTGQEYIELPMDKRIFGFLEKEKMIRSILSTKFAQVYILTSFGEKVAKVLEMDKKDPEAKTSNISLTRGGE